MSESPSPSPEPPPSPLADSPWFWGTLFLVAAIAGLLAVSPKFTQRYARLERMNQTREMMAARERTPSLPDTDDEGETEPLRDVAHEAPQRITLGPLATVLAILLAGLAVTAGVISYWRSAARRKAAAREGSS